MDVIHGQKKKDGVLSPEPVHRGYKVLFIQPVRLGTNEGGSSDWDYQSESRNRSLCCI